MSVKLDVEPKIEPLPKNINVTKWGIVNEREGIIGHPNEIEFDILVEVYLSNNSSRNYRWKGTLPRHESLRGRYKKEKDISAIYQWVRPRLLKKGLYRKEIPMKD